MEPIQQFNEVKGKFPKFVPSEIPSAGLANLKTLKMQQVSFLFIPQCKNYGNLLSSTCQSVEKY